MFFLYETLILRQIDVDYTKTMHTGAQISTQRPTPISEFKSAVGIVKYVEAFQYFFY